MERQQKGLSRRGRVPQTIRFCDRIGRQRRKKGKHSATSPRGDCPRVSCQRLIRLCLDVPPLQNIALLVRILPPPRAWISVPNRDIQNPSVLATERDSKGESIGLRDAKCNAAGAAHGHAWSFWKSQGTRKKCDFHRENSMFFRDGVGFELGAASFEPRGR
jgi:hypothetical protein